MCGIAGIISKEKPLQSDIELMVKNILHRGPDSHNFSFSNYVAFGHSRLSVLDLSEDGNQPMTYKDTFTVTYNGEIYNYKEIQKNLIDLGHTFKSTSDTEVILAAYDQWGTSCVEKFNGMWSFALHDKKNNLVFCSRDRFGIKPFYYTENDGKFYFGSEIKQLLPFLNGKIVNEEILLSYITTGFEEYSNNTFFKGIYKLPPSNSLTYDLATHTWSTKQYYTLEKQDIYAKLSKDESKKVYRKLLEDSITLRLRSDIRVGTCLSGGLDSSTIACMAAKTYNQTQGSFIGIHAKSTEQKTDESHFAREVANAANIDLNIVTPSVEDFINTIDEIVYTQEEPFKSPSIVMQYFVMKKARELQCPVLLDGQGADETLLGYEKYFPTVIFSYLKDQGFQKTVQEIKQAKKNNAKITWKNLVKFSLGVFIARIRSFVYRRRSWFIKSKYRRQEVPIVKELAKAYKEVFTLQKIEVQQTNLPALLKYEDKNSMRHGIETRLPFLDYRVVECALSLPYYCKVQHGWTKYVLRTIADSILPEKIVWRKDKFGFQAPDNTWLEAGMDIMIESIKKSQILQEICNMDDLLSSFETLDPRMQWRLFNIAKWEEMYKVTI